MAQSNCKPAVSAKKTNCCGSNECTCGCTLEQLVEILDPPTNQGQVLLSYNPVTELVEWITPGSELDCQAILECVTPAAVGPWTLVSPSSSFDPLNTAIWCRLENFGETVRMRAQATTNGGSLAISGLTLCTLPVDFRPTTSTAPLGSTTNIVALTGGNVPFARIAINSLGVVSFADVLGETGQMTSTSFEITYHKTIST